MNTTKTIYLSVAGCVFKIVFHPTDWEIAKKNLEKKIKEELSGFMLKERVKHNYRIDFNYRSKIDFVLNSRHPERKYTLCYRRINDKRIMTFYFINIIQFQFILLKDLLSEYLSKHNGFILHACAVNISGKAHVFAGPTGAGKSTMMKSLSRNNLPLGDDSVIIKKEKGVYFAYQTPFTEKVIVKEKGKKRYNLEETCFLEKGKKAHKIKLKGINEISRRIKNNIWNNETTPDQLTQVKDFAKTFNRFYIYSKKDK